MKLGITGRFQFKVRSTLVDLVPFLLGDLCAHRVMSAAAFPADLGLRIK